MVAWRRVLGEEWTDTMRRMIIRMENPRKEYTIKSHQVFMLSKTLMLCITCNQNYANEMAILAFSMKSEDNEGLHPYRKSERPYLRWDDSFHDYCRYEWSLLHWTDMEYWDKERILQLEDRYVQYCML